MLWDHNLSQVIWTNTYDVNLYGVINSILPLCSRFQQRRSGHIAIHSSSASYLVIHTTIHGKIKRARAHVHICIVNHAWLWYGTTHTKARASSSILLRKQSGNIITWRSPTKYIEQIFNVGLTVACPGFIDSELVDHLKERHVCNKK